MQGIYKIENTENGKVYIGRSIDIEKRWKQHKDALASGTHSSYKLQECYNNLQDKTILVFEVVEEISDASKLRAAEQYWIDKYDAYENGYNCSPYANNPKYRKKIDEEDLHNFVFYQSWFHMIHGFEETKGREYANEFARQIINLGVLGEMDTDDIVIKGIVNGMCRELINHAKKNYVNKVNNPTK